VSDALHLASEKGRGIPRTALTEPFKAQQHANLAGNFFILREQSVHRERRPAQIRHNATTNPKFTVALKTRLATAKDVRARL
jgi:hypothetical protein